LSDRVSVVGGDTVIDIDGDGPASDTIILQGFVGALNSGDFHFGV
jgi:hypothetical protein